ncbi:AGE family epimerase/isomerase [Chloroflexi bacterium TSY]|nr:AGE family epimerase/isomerase [Chloroflexi bacterium TSY]
MKEQCIQLAESLKKHAWTYVMEFWLKHGIDSQYGGYWTDLARDGNRYGQGEKWLIVQTRTIYSMCLAFQFFGEEIFLEQAAQGVNFFRRHFRDEQNGGWYYCISRDGTQVLDASKQPYGLAFAAYSLAEFARLAKDVAQRPLRERDVLRDAIETNELVMEKCWDKQYGGLPNKFTPDWQLLDPIKRVDTHMHTMEGVSALYHATRESSYLDRLNLLANTILGRIGVDGCYDTDHGCTKEMFHPDWSEALDRTDGLCNFGHVTEAGWFIAKLAAYTGNERQAQLARGLIDWAIQHGFDQTSGGLFDYGQPRGKVVRHQKVWWNQAELLGALAFLLRTTGEQSDLTLLEMHINFIDQYQLDQQHGEWYPTLNADGTVNADHKGSRWKSPYHVMQGLYHAHKDLRRAAGVDPVIEPKDWADFCL